MRRRTEAKRNAILDVAREVFRKKGYQGTSMSEITEKVGGSKATIYGYFKSKKLLFEAVMNSMSVENASQFASASGGTVSVIPEENASRIAQVVDEMLASSDDIRTTLYDFSRRFISMICQPEFLESYRLIVESSPKTEMGKNFYEKDRGYVIGSLQQCFEAYMAKGELCKEDAGVAAQIFLSLIQGLIFEHHLFGFRRMSRSEIQKRTRQSVDAFLKIYGQGKENG